ncbi:hypothetical protein D3C72_1884870 [compost metagenome]
MLAQTVIERLQPDRLEQAVIHAGNLAFIELLLTSIGRQAQDHTRPPAMVPLLCTVLSRQLEPVHSRHVEVGNDDIHPGIGKQPQGLLP